MTFPMQFVLRGGEVVHSIPFTHYTCHYYIGAQVQCGWQEQLPKPLLHSDTQAQMHQSPPSRPKQEIFLLPSPPPNPSYWGSDELWQLSVKLAHVSYLMDALDLSCMRWNVICRHPL